MPHPGVQAPQGARCHSSWLGNGVPATRARTVWRGTRISLTWCLKQTRCVNSRGEDANRLPGMWCHFLRHCPRFFILPTPIVPWRVQVQPPPHTSPVGLSVSQQGRMELVVLVRVAYWMANCLGWLGLATEAMLRVVLRLVSLRCPSITKMAQVTQT